MLNFLFDHTPLHYLIQSVWRDEAFSYFMAKPGILKIISNTAHDFNPPLYYILLHLWTTLAGRSDELLRLLSFAFHLAAVYVSFLFAKKLFSKKFAVFAGLFVFFNPMLLYYAFEIRMYSLYALWTFCSFYFLYTKNWKGYIASSVLGLYTHSFFPLVILSFAFTYRYIPRMGKNRLFPVLSPFIFYLPWLPVLVVQFFKSKNSWIFPVDFQLIKSVLGNLFTNYEGTPGNWWGYTAILSAIMFFFLLSFWRQKKRQSLPFLAPLFLPLFLILGYSILRRPLFVNRYLIFATVFEIWGIIWGIWLIKNPRFRKITAFFWILLLIYINLAISPYHHKTDFKTAFAEINKFAKGEDYIYSQTPIGFLESVYYYKYPERVFVYNPNHISIPDYIGSNVVFPNASKEAFPPNPSRTFLVADNASYTLIIAK